MATPSVRTLADTGEQLGDQRGRSILLHLEADGALELVDLGLHVLSVAEGGGELASLVQAGAEDTGDLLDERVRGEEGIVGVGCRFVSRATT